MGEDDAAAEQTQRSQRRSQAEADERAEGPGELGGADVPAALIGGSELRDIGPARGNGGSHCQADDDETGEEHGQVGREDDDKTTEGVEEQVVGVDELTSVLVAQRPADEGADGGAEGIGAEGGQKAGNGAVVVGEVRLSPEAE